MLLTEYNICHYLLEKGMLDLPTLIKGDFTARRSDSRNNNFIINREYNSHQYFIKQVKANDQEKIETLRTEAACYQLAHQDALYKALKTFLPHFHLYDPLNHVLVVEQVKEAFSVHDFYFQNGDFNNELPELIADILASYHATTKQTLPASFAQFRQQKPWIFTIATAPPAWPATSQPSVEQQVIQLIYKNPEFVQLLRGVENEWLPSSLVHNDVKFNNLLLQYDMDKKKVKAIKLIDWELADRGDPLWDAAAVLENFLALWVNTDIPEGAGMPAFKKFRLEEVQTGINRFWKRYCQQVPLATIQQPALLTKTVKFAALKLIHSCFEMAPMAPQLQPSSVKMLQMSFNILRSPQDAAQRLFGIY